MPTEPAPTPKFRAIAGVPARPAPETTMVIVLTMPVVAAVNEYAYVTPVALTWLFDTDQLTFVKLAALAGVACNTTRHGVIAITTRTATHRRRAMTAAARVRENVGCRAIRDASSQLLVESRIGNTRG